MKRVAFGMCALLALTIAARADDASPSVASAGGGTRGGSDAAPAAAQPDYVFCTVCHGAHGNGNPAINAPKIAGIEPWYLKQQLTNFRAGVRGTKPSDEPGMEMQPVGVELDDAAIEAVAAYVSKFDAVTPPVTVQGDPKKGRALYATCSACHGSSAEGNSALKAPALAGQTDWYLVRQLERFRNGERGFAAEDTPGVTMRAAAEVLPNTAAVNDLVAYINTLSAKHRGT
jgi:cytochrome c oxidase subunit 2